MCNHDIDRGHCSGDSGGPLFIRLRSRYLQIGVASFGFGKKRCGEFQGGFARLTPNVLSWIKKMMKDEDPDDDMPLEYKRVSTMPEPDCGQRIDSNDPEIKSLQYPWLVDVCVEYEEDKLDSSGNKISCSKLCKGTLISKHDVLTSATCVKTSDENNTVVFLESLNIQDSLKSLDYQFLAKNKEIKTKVGFPGVGELIPPVKIHPDYSLSGTEEYKRAPDVALIKLEKPVGFGPAVNKICLPTTRKTEQDFSNSKAIFATRNEYHPSEGSEVTSKAEVTVKSTEWCRNEYNLNFIQR